MGQLHSIQIEPLITRALEEDWGHGDWTTDLCVEPSRQATAHIVAKQDMVVAGIDLVAATFRLVDPAVQLNFKCRDGQKVAAGSELLAVSGPARAVLKAERVSLNFLGRLSGIATLTSRYVAALEGSGAQLLDTRKTTPGLRMLEKAAVALGGARNHRFGLSDGVMVKENHIRAAGGIAPALEKLRESLSPLLKIEVETTNLHEVEQALAGGADMIMLDNMSLSDMAAALKVIGGKALTEASGNIRLDTIRSIGDLGVDFISTSAVVTAAPWVDISLLFELP